MARRAISRRSHEKRKGDCEQSNDSRMKDVLQLAAAIVMASSAKKKKYDSKSSKTIRMKSFSDNFTVETDDEAMRPEVSFKENSRLYALCCKK